MNVFVGLKFAVWDDEKHDLDELSSTNNHMPAKGIAGPRRCTRQNTGVTSS
ncbi:hypothetical protein [uncultured Erythrobacter sp.]|uniref:hypothetical protein n=1 Tax=uncultured Erythrobacter sp. TaxID=263913 RepID=UPI0026185BC2|nr:hypothetical protein [uncultured Erythrobacter sp.]